MKYFHRLFSILLIAGMLLGWTTSGSILASSPKSAAAQIKPSEKLETGLVDQLNAGPADYIVMMAEQADVSAADKLLTKAEKGEFVFNTLVDTATRTQRGIRSYLDTQGANYQSLYIVNAIWVKQGNLDLAQALAARADVSAINVNHTFKLDEPINPQPSTVQPQGVEPNLTFIKADQVWAMGINGSGTVMAGNDTGLDVTHPAIARHYRGCLNPPDCTSMDHNYNWYDAYAPQNVVPWDDYGHGTHTTGTMVGDDGAGNQIGVAPGAKTVHCKNMQSGNGDEAHFIMCFEWDLAPWDLTGANPRPDLAPDAINNSWGFWGGGNNSMREAIDNLHAAGILVEVSAGNEGSGCQSLRSPGDYQEVLTTGSVDHSGQQYPGVITGFSSRGPSSLDGDYFPDIMAPGNGIRSALPGNSYDYWSGTSMAGPHATALVGLIWSANPALRGQIAQTMDIIRATAAPLEGQHGSNCGGDYTVGPNNDWGYGTIDALAAVQYAIAMGGAGKLNGTVTDADTGDQVQGVSILAEHEAGFAWDKTTDANGYYTMTVAAGTYTVTASANGYESSSVYPVEVITDSVALQNFVLQYIPNVAFSPDAQTKTGEPGTQVTYAYTVTNDAHVPQVIDLSLQSKWPVEAPATTGMLDPEASVSIPVVVTIPMIPDVIIGSDTFTMTATGSVGGVDIATGTTQAGVTPGVLLAAPQGQTGRPNEVLNYTFTITNTGNYTDSFTLYVYGIWTSTLPGGDNTGPVAAGASVKVTVSVAVPSDVSDGDYCKTTLRVTSDLDHTVRKSTNVTSTALVTAPVYTTMIPILRK
jgi:hypothetical protein